MSKPDQPSAPKPRSSRITTSLVVQEAGYSINVDYSDMQLGSVSPVHVKHGDFDLYRDLIDFAASEWQRAKAIEKEANKPLVQPEL